MEKKQQIQSTKKKLDFETTHSLGSIFRGRTHHNLLHSRFIWSCFRIDFLKFGIKLEPKFSTTLGARSFAHTRYIQYTCLPFGGIDIKVDFRHGIKTWMDSRGFRGIFFIFFLLFVDLIQNYFDRFNSLQCGPNGCVFFSISRLTCAFFFKITNKF